MRRIKLFLLIVGFSVMGLAEAQCPMCKTALKSNQKDSAAAAQNTTVKTYGRGINTGILFLLACPYIAAGIGGVLYFRWKKKQKLQTQF